MLDKVDHRIVHPGPIARPGTSEVITLDISAVLRFLRQWSLYITAPVILALAAGIIYLIVTPPRFTATTNILIDARRMELFRQDSVFHETGLNTSVVESEMQVLASKKVAADVVRRLKLDEDPEFTGGGPLNVVSYVISFPMRLVSRLFNQRGAAGTYDPTSGAIAQFQSNLTVRRLGVSYVIQLTYSSFSAEKAAQIANETADAYITDQLAARYQAAERAGAWLQGRIVDLRDQAFEADRAVQTYKAENSIISTGGGKLLSEAQVESLSTQLAAAQNETVQVRARLNRIQEINRSGIPEAAVADVLINDAIVRLRQQYLEAERKLRESEERYGAAHPATTTLRGTLVELQRSIEDELGRLEEIYKSNLDIAERREKSLEASLKRQVELAGEAMQAQVRLRELESVANSYRSLYDTFLQRYTQASQQQSFPISEARVITTASPPDRKSAPKGSIILPLSIALGLGIGITIALVRELASKNVRTTRQLESATETECLGILPVVAWQKERRSHSLNDAAPSTEKDGRLLGRGNPVLSAVLDDPFSRFAETIRSIKVAADVAGVAPRTQVLAITSSVTNEGKSAVSCNLARLIAQTSGRTLLVDCDLRNPYLTQALAPEATQGLAHVLLDVKQIHDVLYHDAATGMHFLPSVLGARVAHTNELVGSEAMERLIQAFRESYDYIILDFPPILPVVDVRAAAHLPDAFVLVVEWDKTGFDTVRSAVSSSPLISQKIIGSVLNKVDVRELSSIEPVRGTYGAGFKG